jgi:hypothetical protein
VGWWAETGTALRSPALKEWRGELERRQEGKQFWREGEEIDLGKDWKVKVLWPPAVGGTGRSEEDGMVLMLESGAARLLWAGSIPGEVEKELVMEYGTALKAGVLVQGPAKRGEANLTREWLEAVEPSTVVRWSRVLEEDTALSVDFADWAMGEGIDLWKLEESGCLTLRPRTENGRWEIKGWKD